LNEITDVVYICLLVNPDPIWVKLVGQSSRSQVKMFLGESEIGKQLTANYGLGKHRRLKCTILIWNCYLSNSGVLLIELRKGGRCALQWGLF